MSSSITTPVPEALADSAKVIVSQFTNYHNWRNVMIVGIPLSLAVGLHWVSGREPVEISVGAIYQRSPTRKST